MRTDRYPTWPCFDAPERESSVRIRASSDIPGPPHEWEVHECPEYPRWREADCRRCGKSMLFPQSLDCCLEAAMDRLGVHPNCDLGVVESVLDD